MDERSFIRLFGMKTGGTQPAPCKAASVHDLTSCLKRDAPYRAGKFPLKF